MTNKLIKDINKTISYFEMYINRTKDKIAIFNFFNDLLITISKIENENDIYLTNETNLINEIFNERIKELGGL